MSNRVEKECIQLPNSNLRFWAHTYIQTHKYIRRDYPPLVSPAAHELLFPDYLSTLYQSEVARLLRIWPLQLTTTRLRQRGKLPRCFDGKFQKYWHSNTGLGQYRRQSSQYKIWKWRCLFINFNRRENIDVGRTCGCLEPQDIWATHPCSQCIVMSWHPPGCQCPQGLAVQEVGLSLQHPLYDLHQSLSIIMPVDFSF